MRRTAAIPFLSLVLLVGLGGCGDFLGPAQPKDSGLTVADSLGGSEKASRFIVTLAPGSAPGAVAAEHGLQPERVFTRALTGFSGSVSEAARLGLMRDSRVVRVERDAVMETFGSQASPPWGLDRIDQRTATFDDTYGYAYTGSGVTVYVVDTGIQVTHHDFEGRASVGVDVFGGDGDDCNGHGTHVAGTVGGAAWGVAKEASLVAVRVLDCKGYGTISGVVAGLDWVIGNASGPSVVNMSMGGAASATLDDAVQRVTEAGISVAVAAGNNDLDACNISPARAPSAMTVGATNRQDARTSWSNYGPCLDLFAPGNEVRSDYIGSTDDATAIMSGTSMASPHVAGVMALALSESPGLSPAEVAAVLMDRATKDVVGTALSANDHLLYSGTSSGGPGDSGGTAPVTNQDPTADFEWTCDGLTCSFHDLSTDADGTVQAWEWALGAGAFSSKQNPTHTYGAEGSYTVSLKVVDDAGASSTKAYTVRVGGSQSDPTVPGDSPDGIQLSVTAGKTKGMHVLEMLWSGTAAGSMDILVDGTVVATVPNSGQYDYVPGTRGKISYRVQVCEAGGGACSSEVTVQF